MNIKELSSEGLSIRDIARETGLSRNTVRKVLRSEHPMRVRQGARASKLDAFKDYVRERFERYQLSAVRLLPEIQALGYTGSLPTLRRYLQGLKGPARRLAAVTVRFETPPGKQAQVDWTECGRFVLASGQAITVYAFVMVLSFSRLMFIHFTTSMRLAELIRCHLLAFDYFGGWPQQILYDNMKQVRTGPGQWNETFLDMANHYGFVIKTHRPYRPRTKGKVERSCDYVKDNFLAGRTFESIEDINAHAHHWLDTLANVRVHGTTGCIPREAAVQENLCPLHRRPAYRLSQIVQRTVNRESLVHYHGSRYSVPPEFAGKTVSVESQGGQIIVRAEAMIVAEHRAALKAGQCVVAKDHLADLWKLTAQQVAVPNAPQGERWHLLNTQVVQRMPLNDFEEVVG